MLRDEGRAALAALAAAARRTQQAARGEAKLVLTFKADIDGRLLEPVIEAYARNAVSVPVEVTLCGWMEQTTLLRDGLADVAFVLGTPAEADIDSELLMIDPQVVGLAATHPLADDRRHRRVPPADYRPVHLAGAVSQAS